MNKFTQVYQHKTTGEKIKARRLSGNDYRIQTEDGRESDVTLIFLKDYKHLKKESKPKRWDNRYVFLRV